MTTTTSSSRISISDLRASVEIIEVKPGVKFTRATLENLLPDVETVLFFGKVYELDHVQLSALLSKLCKSDLAVALFRQADAHSSELQDYLVDLSEYVPNYTAGELRFVGPDDEEWEPPHGEILPEVWVSLELTIASTIKKVAETLADVIEKMPGKQGEMLFQSMKVLNRKRPVIGDYRAHIVHPPQAQNLIILDVSGSMSEYTIRTIAEDVVALGYMANAHFAIVSNTCTYWEPGTYDVDQVLRAAEYGGTHYEQLAPLFDGRDWGTVVTIADYDSSHGAKSKLGKMSGTINTLLDVSLVNQCTFLAECVGQLAKEVSPLLVADDRHYYSPLGA